MIKPVHLLFLLLIVLLLFGAKKLPEIAGSVGKSMKVFKKEVRELRDEDDVPAHGSTAAAPQQLGTQQYAAPQYAQPQQPQYAAPQQYGSPQAPQQYQAPAQPVQPQQYVPADAPAALQVPAEPIPTQQPQHPNQTQYPTQNPGQDASGRPLQG